MPNEPVRSPKKQVVSKLVELDEISHVVKLDPSANVMSPEKLLDDRNLVRLKKVALGQGARPEAARFRIKRFTNSMDDGLSEIMGNLSVDKCGVSCECQDCTVTELGKMVENCLVDARVKLVPSMISYRAMRDKTLKILQFFGQI